MSLMLECPKCHKTALYDGYPAEPVLSTVWCLDCNYVGAGATFQHFHSNDEKCHKGET